MKVLFSIALLIISVTSVKACLNASQNRIFPLGLCEEGLIVMELHGHRGEDIDWERKDALQAEWRATSFLNVYTKDRILVRTSIIDSVIYIAENEYVSTINRTFEKALYAASKIKGFIAARPLNLSFCNYQQTCSSVQLEIDRIHFNVYLNFPKWRRIPIDVLQNPKSIAANYLEQLAAFDYETEEEKNLFIVESLLINSVREFQIGDQKLTIVHLGMGTNYSEEPIVETMPDFDFSTLENSVYEEPVLYHGHGFDFFIWQ